MSNNDTEQGCHIMNVFEYLLKINNVLITTLL